MSTLRRASGAFSFGLFVVCAAGVMFMALAVTYEVMARYLLGSPTIWVSELSSYTLVATAFLGAAWTLRVGGHIRMDLIGETGGRAGRRFSDICMFVVAAIVAVVLLWTGWQMALASFRFGWRASTLLATPLWIPQALIPLSCIALLLESLVGLADTISGRRYESEERA
ncbi:TRAP transporter small permease subunit [Notoacmeibacter ruber]|uniref:TRAP transporter small permease protein n=1 Tax=Notoacmeibacter ruber TaxID=2670375 RepID=A0A3L7J9R7_9HYPH|nr:TRAP transporter small permease [Notoacmeibacter ruber]RLQ87209.1 TRAP transporter small permease [Notoacmeibacter ruber]